MNTELTVDEAAEVFTRCMARQRATRLNYAAFRATTEELKLAQAAVDDAFRRYVDVVREVNERRKLVEITPDMFGGDT